MPYPILLEKQTWYKGTTKKATITQINILTSYTPATTPTESWNADVGNTGAIKCYIEGTKLTIAGNGSEYIELSANAESTFDTFANVTAINNANILITENVTNMAWMFADCGKLQSINVGTWNTSNVTTMRGMFLNVKATEINVTNWDTQKVTDIAFMFYGCTALQNLNLNGWNTSSVKDMSAIFVYCSSLQELNVSSWNTCSVENMSQVFYGCTSLTTLQLSNWNVSKVTTINGIIYGCSSLQTIGDLSNWNTENITNMSYMCNGCSSLQNIGDLSNWNTSSVTDIKYMFYGCSSLQAIGVSNWNTSNVTDMSWMFAHCASLTTLDVSNWNTGKVTTMASMFSQTNYGVTHPPIFTLDVSNWNTSNVTDMSFMFYGMRGLGTVDVSKWNVAKVTNFDHMFAWSYISGIDVSKWDTSSATNMNAMFHTTNNTTIDVSSFNTSNVIAFCQMFENCQKLEKIIGLENFDTSKGVAFGDMFDDCIKLKSLNLSSFDTRQAVDGVSVSGNGSISTTCYRMFSNMHSLEEIILGENFRFNGNGATTFNIAVLPTPNVEYIEYADGNWYSEEGVAYAPSEVPNGAGVYYASVMKIPKLYSIKFGTLKRITNAVREKTTTTEEILTENIPEAILSIKGSIGGTATASEIFLDKTAYVNGEEITGEFTIDTELAEQDTILNQIETALTNKVAGDFNVGYNAAYDEFWDKYQDNGNRTNYNYGFAGQGWNADMFKPKYDIKPTAATRLFADTGITDVKGCLESAGVVLDLSQTTSLVYLSESAATQITRLPELNVTSLTALNNFIYQARALVSIDKVILKDDGSQTFANTSFGYLTSLEEIRFEGVIGKTVTFQWSPLSKASIESIISCLSNTTSGQTLSLQKAAVNKAFETSPGVNNGSTSAEWNLLVNGDGTTAHPGKTNWTINLV